MLRMGHLQPDLPRGGAAKSGWRWLEGRKEKEGGEVSDLGLYMFGFVMVKQTAGTLG